MCIFLLNRCMMLLNYDLFRVSIDYYFYSNDNIIAGFIFMIYIVQNLKNLKTSYVRCNRNKQSSDIWTVWWYVQPSLLLQYIQMLCVCVNYSVFYFCLGIIWQFECSPKHKWECQSQEENEISVAEIFNIVYSPK